MLISDRKLQPAYTFGAASFNYTHDINLLKWPQKCCSSPTHTHKGRGREKGQNATFNWGTLRRLLLTSCKKKKTENANWVQKKFRWHCESCWQPNSALKIPHHLLFQQCVITLVQHGVCLIIFGTLSSVCALLIFSHAFLVGCWWISTFNGGNEENYTSS